MVGFQSCYPIHGSARKPNQRVRRKADQPRRRQHGNAADSDSDDDSSEHDSVRVDWTKAYGGNSDNRSQDDDSESIEFAQEQFEEKFMETLDGLTQKSAQGRTDCLNAVIKVLVKKYIPGFITQRHFTICDSIERCLKKGGAAERAAAAQLACILCVQLGAEDASEDVAKALKSVLLTTALDNSVGAAVRGKCCEALALVSFLSGGEMGDILTIMQHFQSIFSASYKKDASTITPDVASLHTSALSGWGLLLTLMDSDFVDIMESNSTTTVTLKQLGILLESQHVEMRLQVGEILALIFEIGREKSDVFAEDFAFAINDTLKQLATDSAKYRAKKDRKQQRATFRDVLQFIESDEVPEMQIKFGKEVLILDSWTRIKQYDAICTVLGPGINVHLAQNELLRSIFEMSEPIIELEPKVAATSKQEKYRKQMINAANFKARTISRGKNRDKRSDF